MLLRFFGFCKCGKIFLYPPVINAEKFVCTGSHVNVIRLALCPFFIHKGINGIVNRRTLDKTVHDLEECLAQVWRTLLGRRYAFLDMLSGIVFSWVNTDKSGQRSAVCETCHISNLYSLPVQSTGYHTNAFGFNLRKTNAANEEWLADFSTDAKSWEVTARPIALLILTA